LRLSCGRGAILPAAASLILTRVHLTRLKYATAPGHVQDARFDRADGCLHFATVGQAESHGLGELKEDRPEIVLRNSHDCYRSFIC